MKADFQVFFPCFFMASVRSRQPGPTLVVGVLKGFCYSSGSCTIFNKFDTYSKIQFCNFKVQRGKLHFGFAIII